MSFNSHVSDPKRRYVVKSARDNPGVTIGGSYVGELGVTEPVAFPFAVRVSIEVAQAIQQHVEAKWPLFAPWTVQPVDIITMIREAPREEP